MPDTNYHLEESVKYPIGTQSFEIIRKEGYLYIDKTMFIKPLMDFTRYAFLSRPRRFGKSLFMSMLEAYFTGRKELFEGLAIADQETEWKKYPIIHLDLSTPSADDGKDFTLSIRNRLSAIASTYGLKLWEGSSIGGVVDNLIRELHEKTGERVVLLVDEYDVSLHQSDENSKEYEEKQRVLRSLFMQFKSADDHVRFCFVTGVARFNQLSLFSGPNNIADISMNKRFASICGFTREELESYCHSGIARFAEAEGISYDDMLQKLVENYDGYRFTKQDVKVFNPLSIISSLNEREIRNYWVNTGTTAFFVKKLMDPDFRLPELTEQYYDEEMLCSMRGAATPASWMFQSGYLTIDKCLDFGLYTLRIPNREMKDSLTKIMADVNITC